MPSYVDLRQFKKMQIKRKNLFQYTKETHRTFSLVRKILDMHDHPYILKFRDSDKEVFFLMASDFTEQVHKGSIIFTPD